MKTRPLLALVSSLFAAALAFGQSAAISDTRIVNLSTRGRVSAENPLITGFAISGTEPRTVLVRVSGPTLVAYGITDALAQPRLRLHDSKGNVVMENAGWADSPALTEAFLKAGAFPFASGSKDAALVATVAPGVYTMEALDASEANPGVALLEVYDIDSTAKDSRLVNVSTRTTVGIQPGEEVITGFILAGSSSKRFLMRGVGPGLTNFGVADSLVNPTLALYDSAGNRVADNDNWSPQAAATVAPTATPQAIAAAVAAGSAAGTSGGASATITPANPVPGPPMIVSPRSEVEMAAVASGAFALAPGSYDSAFLVTLAPGAYTLQIKSADSFEVQITNPPTGTSGVPSSPGSTLVAAPAAATTVAIVPKPAKPGVGLLEIYEVP